MNTIEELLTPAESQQSGLSTLTLTEAETRAYIKGDTLVAALLGRIRELEEQIEQFEDVETLEHWEKRNGPADQYKEFFFECFERLAKRYPCPSVTNDHDKSVIFDAIERGEDVNQENNE